MSVGIFPGKTVVLILLSWNALQDLRYREILPRVTLGVLALGAIWNLLFARTPLLLFLSGLLPGLVFLLLAAGLRGKIGGGDGLVLLAAGAWSGLEILLPAVLAAMLLVLISAVFFLLSGKICRIRENGIPFIPYLLGGYVLVLLSGLL